MLNSIFPLPSAGDYTFAAIPSNFFLHVPTDSDGTNTTWLGFWNGKTNWQPLVNARIDDVIP
jgi:hypothetical protein